MTAPADRLNWSTLRHLAISPRLLRWRVDHPAPDSPALKLGRAIHCAVLEPEAFASRWIVAGRCAAATKAGTPCGSQGSLYHSGEWYCRVRGHAPEGASADLPEGLEVLDEADRQLAQVCAESVRAHGPAAKLLAGGAAEQKIEWTDAATDIACRGRIDYLRADLLVDLKSTRRETLRDIAGDAARHLYHGQLAWYHDGAVAAGLLPADALGPMMIAVETVEPYDVAVLRLSVSAYQAGQILYRDLIRRYSQCVAADWWPGIAPDIEVLDLPRWAPGMEGSAEGEEW